MKRAGFQLTARFVGGEHHGKQAGTFRGRDGRVQIDRAPSGVEYARHSPGGVIGEAIGSRARWHLEWRAPRRPSGVVVIHAAANAANHDDSELGDTVYTHEVQIAAGPR